MYMYSFKTATQHYKHQQNSQNTVFYIAAFHLGVAPPTS